MTAVVVEESSATLELVYSKWTSDEPEEETRCILHCPAQATLSLAGWRSSPQDYKEVEEKALRLLNKQSAQLSFLHTFLRHIRPFNN